MPASPPPVISASRDFRGWQGDADSWLRIIMPTNPLIMAAFPNRIEVRFNLGFRHVEAALFSHAIIERMPVIDLFAWFFKFIMNLERAIGVARMLHGDLIGQIDFEILHAFLKT